MTAPIGFRGIYKPEPVIEHAIDHWSKRVNGSTKDWITAMEAKPRQQQNDALRGLYNALYYYEQENESNLGKRKSAEISLDKTLELGRKLSRKTSIRELLLGISVSISLLALLIIYNVMSEKLEDARSQSTVPRLVLPPST